MNIINALVLTGIFLYSGPTWPGPTLTEVTQLLNSGGSRTGVGDSNKIDDNLVRIYALELKSAGSELKKGVSWEEKKKSIFQSMSIANAKLRESLNQKGEIPSATMELAQSVQTELMTNKVSNFGANSKYDKDGDIGFCFGRAAFAHYLLLKKNVPQNNIMKIFAMGPSQIREQIWDFHMATMVRGAQGKWLVIDGLFEKALSLDEWMKKVSEFDLKYPHPHMRFYTTDPRKFQASYGQYETKFFEIPELKPFFTDLFTTL